MATTIAAPPLDWLAVAGIAVALGLTVWLVFKELLPRATALLLGATLCIVWGTARDFFTARDALASVSLQTLILLVTMTVVSNTLARGGAFDYLGIQILRLAGGDRRRLFWALCMFTFTFSLVADNLTVMLIAGALAIGLLTELRIAPTPFVIGILISTNTGGASTAIGDFPNMTLAERGGIPFLAFLAPLGMLWICLAIQVAVTAFLDWQHRAALATPAGFVGALAARLPVALVARRQPAAIRSRRAVVAGAAALVLAIALFATSGTLHRLTPTEIGLLAAVVALAGSGLDHDEVLDEVGVTNLMSFVGLFVLAGAAEHSGVIAALGARLLALAGGRPLALALLILAPIAVVTAAVDAGPATAAFVPLIAALNAALHSPGYLLWWSLSIAVCAGSSATILGATAGTVAAGQLDRWRRAMPGGDGAEDRPRRGGFVAAFSRSGLPAALLMLLLGAAYLALGFWWYGR